MYCHDSKVLYYVIAGDRVFCCPLSVVLVRGVDDATGDGRGAGGPAGPSPFNPETAVVGLAEMLLDEAGEQRSLAPLGLTSQVGVDMLAKANGVRPTELLSAVSLWSDYCDEVSGHLDTGVLEEDAFRIAGVVPLARAA